MIICDLDGTLCKPAKNALHCMGHMTKDDILLAMDPVKIAKLEPREDVIYKLHWLQDELGENVIVITGRWNLLEHVTIAWLKEYNIRYVDLFMRQHEDWKREAVSVKVQLAAQFMPSISTWIDDDDLMLAALPDRIRKVKV